jgi:hypothetical protein
MRIVHPFPQPEKARAVAPWQVVVRRVVSCTPPRCGGCAMPSRSSGLKARWKLLWVWNGARGRRLR